MLLLQIWPGDRSSHQVQRVMEPKSRQNGRALAAAAAAVMLRKRPAAATTRAFHMLLLPLLLQLRYQVGSLVAARLLAKLLWMMCGWCKLLWLVVWWLLHWTCNSRCCRFDSWPVCCHVTTQGKLFSVTNQCGLVPAKGQWCSAAGKVITGLAESNGSLLQGIWLCHLWADWLDTRILILHKSHGHRLPVTWHLLQVNTPHLNLSQTEADQYSIYLPQRNAQAELSWVVGYI